MIIPNTAEDVVLHQAFFIVPLILHAFAVFSVSHLLWLQLREDPLGRHSWGGWAWRSFNAVLLIYYINFLWQYLAFLLSYGRPGLVPFLLTLAYSPSAALICALLIEVIYAVQDVPARVVWFWRGTKALVWIAALVAAAARVLWCAGWLTSAGPVRAIQYLQDGVTAFTVILCGARLLATGKELSAFHRRQRIWYFTLAAVVLAGVLLKWTTGSPYVEQMALRFLPLLFLFITTFYGERQAFFDLCVKRGLFFLVTLLAATSFSAIMLPTLRPWVFTYWFFVVPVFPIVLAAPWFYAALNRWVDRVWLRRTFSAQQSLEYLTHELHGALTGQELLETAEASLSHIFRSRVCIDLGGAALADASSGELAVRFGGDGQMKGVVRVLPRNDNIPFLSEDGVLLSSLMRSFDALLENQFLKDENLRSSERARELQLTATQSRLMALRAQINPHFLFNALGAIAELIPRDPLQAENTVERLADVFRYTLRRSEREWVRLADELEFVQAYLSIERARFGPRLQVETCVDGGLADLQIPAMTLQVLVENAVKHGVASVPGEGWVQIAIRHLPDRIEIAVEDNGPGFREAIQDGATPLPRNGYGLRNVQNRLSIYYGDRARLRCTRDEVAALTRVSIELPVDEASG